MYEIVVSAEIPLYTESGIIRYVIMCNVDASLGCLLGEINCVITGKDLADTT